MLVAKVSTDVQEETVRSAFASLEVNGDNEVVIGPLVALLSVGTGTQQEKAAAALDSLATSDENAAAIAAAGGRTALIGLQRNSKSIQLKEQAASVLSKLPAYTGED